MKDVLDENTDRKAWMSLLAKAPEGHAAALLTAYGSVPEFTWLRSPEIGSMMVQARAGGTGTRFNLGEMTVTRCALKLNTGEVGHAYIQGRRKADAQAAALVDAMMQTADAAEIETAVLSPLAADAQSRQSARAAKAAATKVDFFTMARGED